MSGGRRRDREREGRCTGLEQTGGSDAARACPTIRAAGPRGTPTGSRTTAELHNARGTTTAAAPKRASRREADASYGARPNFGAQFRPSKVSNFGVYADLGDGSGSLGSASDAHAACGTRADDVEVRPAVQWVPEWVPTKIAGIRTGSGDSNRLALQNFTSRRWDSNPRRPAWEGGRKTRPDRTTRQFASNNAMLGGTLAKHFEWISASNGSENGFQQPSLSRFSRSSRDRRPPLDAMERASQSMQRRRHQRRHRPRRSGDQRPRGGFPAWRR